LVLIIHIIDKVKNIYTLSNTPYRYSVQTVSNTRYSAKFGTRFSPTHDSDCIEPYFRIIGRPSQCKVGERDRDRQTDIQTYIHTYRQTDGQTDRQADRQWNILS